MNEALLTKALAACNIITAREAAYEDVNKQMESLGPEFSWRVRAIDDDMRNAFLDVLNEVFAGFGGCPADDPHVGGEASYFLDECLGGRAPHEVTYQGKSFKLASTDDLRAWIEWQRVAPPPSQGEEKP